MRISKLVYFLNSLKEHYGNIKILKVYSSNKDTVIIYEDSNNCLRKDTFRNL